MRQSLVLRGISQFRGMKDTGLIPRNAGTTEFNQPSAHLPQTVLALIPRPVERGQGDGQNSSSDEFEQEMGDTQKERPAPHALSRAPLIVAQPQFFDLIEVDFDLEAA